MADRTNHIYEHSESLGSNQFQSAHAELFSRENRADWNAAFRDTGSSSTQRQPEVHKMLDGFGIDSSNVQHKPGHKSLAVRLLEQSTEHPAHEGTRAHAPLGAPHPRSPEAHESVPAQVRSQHQGSDEAFKLAYALFKSPHEHTFHSQLANGGGFHRNGDNQSVGRQLPYGGFHSHTDNRSAGTHLSNAGFHGHGENQNAGTHLPYGGFRTNFGNRNSDSRLPYGGFHSHLR